MAFRGITFSKQAVSSNDDSHLYGVFLNGRNGRTKGCKITFGTDDIYISEGYFMAANRLVSITSTEAIATPAITSGLIYCRLVFEVDLSKTNTNNEFNQGVFRVLTDSADYPEITQNDMESGGNVYQLPFAKFTKNISGIGSFVSELETIGSVAKNTTIHVSTSGNDASGDGSESYPYRTIQHAIDTIPKNLAGHTITINIAFGDYAEKLVFSDFYGGKIIIGNPGSMFIIRGLEIDNCSCVESNIYQIEKGTATGNSLFAAKNGSNVVINSNTILDGVNRTISGISAENNSRIAASNNIIITANNCVAIASATGNSFIYLDTIEGSENVIGVSAAMGAVISYKTDNASKDWGNNAASGGLVLTGSNSTSLSGATLDL